MTETERIISQVEQLGLPISAPVYHDDELVDPRIPPIRWVKRKNSFVLEYKNQNEWVEVPYWED